MKMFFRMSKFLNKRFGVVPPEKIRSFYDDYHRYLKSQGVDGVKVDAQSVVRKKELWVIATIYKCWGRVLRRSTDVIEVSYDDLRIPSVVWSCSNVRMACDAFHCYLQMLL